MKLKLIKEYQNSADRFRGIRSDLNVDDYISPDDIWIYSSDPIAFIYNADGEMHYGFDGQTHNRIIKRYLNYYGVEGKPLSADYRRILKAALLGRIGEHRLPDKFQTMHSPRTVQMVSFWNVDRAIYDRLLQPCLDRLLSDGAMNDEIFVSIPFIGVVQFNDVANSVRDTEPDADLERRMEMMHQLHLMQPDAKKAAMKELGLAQGYKKNLWQQRAEELDLVKPGHKWWAMSSEARQ